MTSLRLRREGIHGLTIRGYRVRVGRISHRGIGRSWLVHPGDGRKGGRRRGCHGHRPLRTGGFPPPSARGSATRRRRSAARAAPPYARLAPRRGRCPEPHVDRLLRATGTRPRSAAFGADDRLDRAGASPDVARTRSPLPARRSHEVGLQPAAGKSFLHPDVGRLDLDCQTLLDPDQSHLLLVYTASPGSESYQNLELLSVIAAA